MEAFKRAYAEVMLNTATESAARVLAAERRAAGLAGGLAAAKEDAVAALLRLKAIMDSKIKEVELQSLVHVKKIQELEVQLHDAQNTIASLEAALQRANTEMDQTMKTLAEENRNSVSTSDTIDCCEKSIHYSKLHIQDGSRSPAAPETSCVKNKSTANRTHCAPRNTKENKTVENLEDLCNCSPDLEPFMIRHREPELYHNGCTQRIHALEHHGLSAKTPLGQSDEQAGELKSYLITGKNSTAKRTHSTRSIVEEILHTKNLANYKCRRGRRSKPIYKHVIRKEQKKTEYEPSDTSDKNGCMLLLQALEQSLSSAKVSDRQGGNQLTDPTDSLLIGSEESTLNLCSANSGGKDTLQIKKIQMQKRKRSKAVGIFELGSSDSKGFIESAGTLLRETNENIMLDSKLSSGMVENHNDTTPRVARLPLVQCTTETMADAMPRQFDSENRSKLILEPMTIEVGGEGNMPVDHLVWKTRENNTAHKKEEVNNVEICNLDSDKADAPIASSVAKEENLNMTCGIPTQAEGARCIKYTFNRRKRKIQPLDNATDSTVPDKGSSLVSPAEKQEPVTKHHMQVLLLESPRSNRRLLQVAQQLVLLSGNKC